MGGIVREGICKERVKNNRGLGILFLFYPFLYSNGHIEIEEERQIETENYLEIQGYREDGEMKKKERKKKKKIGKEEEEKEEEDGDNNEKEEKHFTYSSMYFHCFFVDSSPS